MGHYVYQYLHPEYGHLYCGRTEDLDKRIYEHNNLERDNISREYEKLLKESIVMYIELKNKAQEIAVEAYCIDKYKPYLNKSLKYDDDDFVLEMKLPKWKIYEPLKLKYKKQLLEVKKEKEKIIEDISNIENDIKTKKDDLNRMKFELEKINYEIKTQDYVRNNNVLFGFDLKDIKWFYEHCDNKNVKFYSEVYDKIGNMTASGCIYYNSDRNKLELKYWSGINKDNTERIVTDEEVLFELVVSTLYKFYPDINIYPELYASLLSKKDELLIMNNTYNLKDLMKNHEGYYIYSADRSSKVMFKKGKIHCCQVILDLHSDVYKGVYNLPTSHNKIEYLWDERYGISLVDEEGVVFDKKEDIDNDIKNYIFSCEYYHPDRNENEEKYCNKMLQKYNI